MSLHPLTNFKTQKYYQNESTFHDVLSRNNLLEKNHGAYVLNLDKYKSTGTGSCWIALNVSNYNVTYFYSFGIVRK